MSNWEAIDIHYSKAYSGTPALAPLTNYALITVTGPDTEKFLQGQCTCDFASLSHVEPSGPDMLTGSLGAHCTPKGRMIASFVAAKLDEQTIGLRVHKSIVEPALASLRKYGVFSKVDIQRNEDTALFGILNTTAEADVALKTISGKYISQSTLLNECWIKTTDFTKDQQNITEHFVFVEENYWQLNNIQNGVGEVRSETVEALLPQEINFQLTNAISFKKGCYTGQEIVARMHYKAQLKKHMRRAEIDSTFPPAPGEVIHILENDKKLGTVIYSAQKSQSQCELLVLANDDSILDQSVKLGDELQVKLRWLPLPYAIN